jgi:hypothetical protein
MLDFLTAVLPPAQPGAHQDAQEKNGRGGGRGGWRYREQRIGRGNS